ncbi:hypothetical protein GALL_426040 [mine drainage metagenome]|uniref:Uncharacterized protein n=1 Tax=mine drainage metagenome TaxID=410659 RepID=A0A1J5PXE9_9ZZZZ
MEGASWPSCSVSPFPIFKRCKRSVLGCTHCSASTDTTTSPSSKNWLRRPVRSRTPRSASRTCAERPKPVRPARVQRCAVVETAACPQGGRHQETRLGRGMGLASNKVHGIGGDSPIVDLRLTGRLGFRLLREVSGPRAARPRQEAPRRDKSPGDKRHRLLPCFAFFLHPRSPP